MATIKNLSVASLGAVFIALGTTGVVQAAQIFYGEPQPLGDGSVRSFVTLDDVSKQPSDIGLAFTPRALSLPTDNTEPDQVITELSLPSEAPATAFNSIELVYRPHAYPGDPKAFSVPRFGINFFLLSPQEQASICPHPDTSGSLPTCVGDELAQATKTPEPGTLPEGLQPTPGAQPGYGSRYYDPDIGVPIITGQKPFTTAYDYGFFDGKLSVMDFTSSIPFLETQPNVTIPIKLPTSYSRSGYYPTEYSVTYDAASQEYRMTFSELTYRSVPEPSPSWGLLALGAWGAIYRVKAKWQQQKLAQR